MQVLLLPLFFPSFVFIFYVFLPHMFRGGRRFSLSSSPLPPFFPEKCTCCDECGGKSSLLWGTSLFQAAFDSKSILPGRGGVGCDECYSKCRLYPQSLLNGLYLLCTIRFLPDRSFSFCKRVKYFRFWKEVCLLVFFLSWSYVCCIGFMKARHCSVSRRTCVM